MSGGRGREREGEEREKKKGGRGKGKEKGKERKGEEKRKGGKKEKNLKKMKRGEEREKQNYVEAEAACREKYMAFRYSFSKNSYIVGIYFPKNGQIKSSFYSNSRGRNPISHFTTNQNLDFSGHFGCCLAKGRASIVVAET